MLPLRTLLIKSSTLFISVSLHIPASSGLKPFSFMEWKALDEETGDKLISIMEEIGIANSTSYIDDEEGQKYINSLEEVTEEMIYEEILTYINEHPDNTLNMILEHVRDS